MKPSILSAVDAAVAAAWQEFSAPLQLNLIKFINLGQNFAGLYTYLKNYNFIPTPKVHLAVGYIFEKTLS